MSAMGDRERLERDVLVTLLEQEGALSRLPARFTGKAFEFPEYRALYESIRNEFERLGRAPTSHQLLEKHPDFKALLPSLLLDATPLNGEFTNMAVFLLEHRPWRRSDEGTRLSGGLFRFELLNGLEICQMEMPPQSFLIENLIGQHSANFLYGETGSGKSLLAMNLALAVAVQASTWLCYRIAKGGKVVYLNNELAFLDFGRRLKAMAASPGMLSALSNLIAPKEVPSLEVCWPSLVETCERERPCLVVVDCLYFAHDMKENDGSDMKGLMRQFLALRDRFGLAVLVVHHTKKGTRYETMHNDQMRGSSVFGGMTDTAIQLRRVADGHKRILKPTKLRHVGDDNSACRLLSLDPESLWFKDEGETDERDHIAVAGQTAEQEIDFREVFGERVEMSRKDILKECCSSTGYDERTIDRCLKAAVTKGLLKKGRFGHYEL